MVVERVGVLADPARGDRRQPLHRPVPRQRPALGIPRARTVEQRQAPVEHEAVELVGLDVLHTQATQLASHERGDVVAVLEIEREDRRLVAAGHAGHHLHQPLEPLCLHFSAALSLTVLVRQPLTR